MNFYVKKGLSLLILGVFFLNSIIPSSYAQTIFSLPTPGTVTFSPPFTPPLVRGITLYPDHPLKFDFIVDVGDDHLAGDAFQKESMKLIKYFLVSLTVPEGDMWVNLSPSDWVKRFYYFKNNFYIGGELLFLGDKSGNKIDF